MKSTSRIGMVFFCAESKIAVCSVSHRLGSFRRFGGSQIRSERCDCSETQANLFQSAAVGAKRWDWLELGVGPGKQMWDGCQRVSRTHSREAVGFTGIMPGMRFRFGIPMDIGIHLKKLFGGRND